MSADTPAAPVSIARSGALEVRATEGDRWLIELSGELDLSNAQILNQELHLAEVSDASQIVIDLSHLSFLDSSGLQVLLRAASRIHERLRLVPAPPNVQSVFRLSRTEEMLPFLAAEA